MDINGKISVYTHTLTHAPTHARPNARAHIYKTRIYVNKFWIGFTIFILCPLYSDIRTMIIPRC